MSGSGRGLSVHGFHEGQDSEMEIKSSVDILKLDAFSTAQYEHLALTTLTAYSVFWLSEWGIQPSLETVAVLNFRLFPAKFAMVGWPQFPDLNRTNRSVLQMRPKYRNLATSITKRGVFLNDNGLKEAEGLIGRIGSPRMRDDSGETAQVPIPTVRGENRPRSIHPEDQVAKVRSSRLYELFNGGRWQEVEAIDLVNFLGVYDHTPSKEKLRRLREMRDAAEQVKDEQVVDFLEKVASTFRGYLHRQTRGAR